MERSGSVWEGENVKYYRFSIDDNIRVFRDLARKPYTSIFENDYLALLKSVHERYGTKIQLNIYYAWEDFSLAQMPERYKEEWERVSDWLRLSFHAYSDDTRYTDSGYDTLYADCSLVHRQIRRFAGERSLSYYTTLHYVACPKAGVEALRDCGIKGLVGLYGSEEKPRIPYHLTAEVSAFMRENCFYTDEETGMRFMANDIVLNSYKAEEILPILETKRDKPFVEVMIHEQYYHRDFWLYQPDFAEKLHIAMDYLTGQDYIPAFFEDILQ